MRSYGKKAGYYGGKVDAQVKRLSNRSGRARSKTRLLEEEGEAMTEYATLALTITSSDGTRTQTQELTPSVYGEIFSLAGGIPIRPEPIGPIQQFSFSCTACEVSKLMADPTKGGSAMVTVEHKNGDIDRMKASEAFDPFPWYRNCPACVARYDEAMKERDKKP